MPSFIVASLLWPQYCKAHPDAVRFSGTLRRTRWSSITITETLPDAATFVSNSVVVQVLEGRENKIDVSGTSDVDRALATVGKVLESLLYRVEWIRHACTRNYRLTALDRAWPDKNRISEKANTAPSLTDTLFLPWPSHTSCSD